MLSGERAGLAAALPQSKHPYSLREVVDPLVIANISAGNRDPSTLRFFASEESASLRMTARDDCVDRVR